ncbi:multidrug transporter [Echinicola strongylocentroti]|uniref:Multidrug transporter n=1 Tax=Echinicola strongylocentroti TaxID=1795355 RepID=A0A2Z4ILN3_9BACT|nr:HlyD family efflux transporter periplasmic adaptor subunit [Echinicola strongylocentroti]AWW31303.1 multidrug transporter [Echinicola strongylocentroti]
MKTIFPASIVNQTTEYYQGKISVRSKVIYTSVLVALAVMLVSLPFIYVDVSVSARGSFQTSLGRNEIHAPVSGRVSSINIVENESVKQGQVLAEIKSDQVDLEIDGVNSRKALVQNFIADLRKLMKVSPNQIDDFLGRTLTTKYYQAAFFEYVSGVQQLQTVLEKEKRDLKRAKVLFDSKAISAVDYDEYRSKFEQSLANLDIYHSKKISSWEQELRDYQNEFDELANSKKLLRDRLHQYKIVAGVAGTIINFENIKMGDFVFANQKMAEISPDSTLKAVAFLDPADIAFVQPGQKVNFQVDAYDYNQWGLLEGTVEEIAKDINMISENEVAFRVICNLSKEALYLKNGVEGDVKRGMTFNGRFLVARRSLYQLLYDKVDDWLNPALKN